MAFTAYKYLCGSLDEGTGMTVIVGVDFLLDDELFFVGCVV